MIPKNLQPVLWSVNTDKLDLQINKTYIIHQILAYGTWDQIKWLFTAYTSKTIRQVFSEFPSKDYVPASFNFVKNHLLKISENIDPVNYVKTFPRHLG